MKTVNQMEIDTWLDSIEPAAPARDASHIRRIIAAVQELDGAVTEAKAAGDPWSMIATALGAHRHAYKTD